MLGIILMDVFINHNQYLILLSSLWGGGGGTECINVSSVAGNGAAV